MRLWKRASGVIKDRNSLIAAALSRRTAFRHPDIEAAVIHATSHDDSHVDYDAAKRVFKWIRLSPVHLRQFAWALSARMEKTRCWVVALKGLILMHGVFCCKIPAVQRIGRLPFDLSSFKDGHATAAKMWGFNAFVRAYYAFLDHKSALICSDLIDRKAKIKDAIDEKPVPVPESPIHQELVRLQKLQGLLDMLLQIKPQHDGMGRIVILEAIDCVLIEIYDIYSRICTGIAKVLTGICSASKVEATVALKVLQKATAQGDDLAAYFEYCKQIGVLKAAECPVVVRIPEEDIAELEKIICGVSEKAELQKAIVVSETRVAKEVRDPHSHSQSGLKTIITNDWEVFDEDLIKLGDDDDDDDTGRMRDKEEDPFGMALIVLDHHVHQRGNHQELPDLISFL